ncbi:hypothetical protein Tco_0010712 [Tanacetum coccineum]
MTRSTVKWLTKPLDKPEREFRRLKRAAWRLHQNVSLAIAKRNLFDAEASSSNNTGAKPPTPPKTLHEHSHPNPSGLRNKDPLHHVKCYLSIVDNIHADRATRDTSRLRFFHLSLKGKVAEWLNRIPLLKSRHGISSYHDSLTTSFRKLDQFAQFRFNSLTKEEGWNQIEEYVQYQDDLWDDMSPPMNNDDTPPWGNNKRKEKGEDGPEWIIRNKFEDELANFMLEKKSHAKGIGNMFDQHRKELHEQFSQILSKIRESETPKFEAPTFAITTRSGVSTQDPPFSASPRPTSDNLTEGEIKKERPEGEEPSIIQEPVPWPSIFYQPSKSSNLPFPSRLKK